MRRAGLLLLLASGCAPELGPPEYLVTAARLLAVRADPPEVRPGERASFSALLVGPEGELNASAAAWAVCTAPLPLTETGAVASACLGDLPTSAQGNAVSLATSPDACARFGPIGSPEVQRARAADSTGGYYQPVRVRLGDQTGFSLQRLRCPLAQASFQSSQEYERRYSNNLSPALGPLTGASSLDRVPAGSTIALSVSWDAAAAESFPVLDSASQRLIDQAEALGVSWFVTGGSLRTARTGASGNGSENRWTAPAAPGRVYLWAVVRDSRGGLSWASAVATIVEAPR